MNSQVLIEQIVRQTMVLIAQLATSGGGRAPLAHVADRVFLELSRELDAQGVSKNVSADMFGVALRSYRRRIQRLSESVTEQGRSLWSALLDFIPADRWLPRAEILRHFALDEEVQLRSILGDLRDSGLILQLGRGVGTSYRASTRDELSQLGGSEEGLRQLVWLVIYRQGPLSKQQLHLELPSLSLEQLDSVVEELLDSGRASLANGLLVSQEVVVAAGDPHGWEAALLDHFQALVRTLVTRLRGDADPKHNGGSTYGFELGPDHPLASDVYGFLDNTRRELSELRRRVEDYNRAHPQAPRPDRVTLYFGQHAISEREAEDSDDDASNE